MAHKIIKFRTVNLDIFEAIVKGMKRYETRAATSKYTEIKVGDIITLTCGKKRMEKQVVEVIRFRTIGALLKRFKPEDINPRTHTVKEAREMWYGFPGYKEKIRKYGLVVWRLK